MSFTIIVLSNPSPTQPGGEPAFTTPIPEVFRQTVDTLDLPAVIKAVNGIGKRRSRKAPKTT